jgi:hypothetical protein
MKRDLINFSKKITFGLSKSKSKFIIDMMFGISKSGSVLTSNVARSLKEDIKLSYTIERLCDNLAKFDNTDCIMNNYYNEVGNNIGDEPVVLFDNSDITKIYGKKFEDLDAVIDGSSVNKEVKPGYHVCEAVVLGKNEKQPISLYSNIYSTKSKNFESENKYTFDSIDACIKVLNGRFIGVFDRGYDNNQIINYMDKSNNGFVIRMKDKRIFLFKGKRKNCYEEAIKRKGKIKMKLLFDDNIEYDVYVSHTKVTLPYNKKEYELVIVYGLSEERPLILLTNQSIHSKEDVIKIVRLYFSRWRIEEYFRAKKQEYDFENIRVRSLKSMNNLNTLLTIYLGYVSMLSEKIDKKLLTIKIIEASKSLRNKVIVWLSQMARGIREILSFCQTGIKEWQNVEIREKYKQIQLKF